MGSGRGPTRLIWPLNTFHSCGSSSSESRRRSRPTGVMRGSLRILNSAPSASFDDSSDACSEAAPSRIERNFSIMNGCSAIPIRSSRYSTGPREREAHCERDHQQER